MRLSCQGSFDAQAQFLPNPPQRFRDRLGRFSNIGCQRNDSAVWLITPRDQLSLSRSDFLQTILQCGTAAVVLLGFCTGNLRNLLQ